MKKMMFLSIIAFSIFSITSNSYSAIQKQYGSGWVITGGFNVVGAMDYVEANEEDDEGNPTKITVGCSGEGYCARVTSDGYIDIDCGGAVGCETIQPIEVPADPLLINEKRFIKNSN